jgi:hypothetical protein
MGCNFEVLTDGVYPSQYMKNAVSDFVDAAGYSVLA